MPESIIIALVGIDEKVRPQLSPKIIPIARTQNIAELAELYASADVVLNLSAEETFGMTTVEGLAAGTPGIVFDSSASPELITHETGFVVPVGDLVGVQNALFTILVKGKSAYSAACRERAVEHFNAADRFREYIALYENALAGTPRTEFSYSERKR